MFYHLKYIYIANIFLFILLIHISLTSNLESRLNPEFLNHYQEQKTRNFQFKLISCLSLISTSLNNPEGNIYLLEEMKKTKLNREKFYDKYTIALITQCVMNINDGQLDYLLIPENVDNYNLKNKTLLNLIKLDYEIKTLELTNKEKEILRTIKEVIEKKEEIKKSGFLFFNLNRVIKFICCAFPFGLLLLYNIKKKMETEHKKGTKDLLEMIKAKEKNNLESKAETYEDKNKNKKKEIKSNKKIKKE